VQSGKDMTGREKIWSWYHKSSSEMRGLGNKITLYMHVHHGVVQEIPNQKNGKTGQLNQELNL
jgi:hypothetical protein